MPVNHFVIWPGTDSTPRAIVPSEHLTSMPMTDSRYFVQILAELDRLLPDAGLTFVLTWHLDRFDARMKDSVVLLVGDEMYQTPSYINRVRAVFKTGGIRRNPLSQTLRLPFSVSWRVMLRDARNAAVRFRRALRFGAPSDRQVPIHPLPLGYFALQETVPAPVEQRPVDVFFAGSLSVSGRGLRPSVHARLQMSAALAECRAALPQHRIESTIDVAAGARVLSPEQYTRALAGTKIALTPRGNFDETFRLFEAAKLGCIIVSEPLPPRWYYENCPVQIIRAWSDLPAAVERLLSNLDRLGDLSQQTRRWWDETLSEPAIAKYISMRIGSAGAQ